MASIRALLTVWVPQLSQPVLVLNGLDLTGVIAAVIGGRDGLFIVLGG